VLTNADMLREWSQLHDGYDVDRSRFVRAWLLAVHVLAVPLARWRVAPTAVTFVGVGVAGFALVSAPLLAAVLVVLAALCDGLDGAVALRRGIAGRPHARSIDHAADRVTDVLFAAALWHAGASWLVAATAAVTTLGYETVRSLLRSSDRDVAVVTVGERPIRVVVIVVALVASPLTGAVIIALATVVGTVVLTRVGARHRKDVAMTRGTHDGSHQLEEDNRAS
jgi:CDP-diacylglycerol--glycerol-3-phosphate 3-phosphatidyltransferase